jgi:hypothetical protein
MKLIDLFGQVILLPLVILFLLCVVGVTKVFCMLFTNTTHCQVLYGHDCEDGRE